MIAQLFYCVEGAVRVMVHRTSFVITSNGMFMVPRGAQRTVLIAPLVSLTDWCSDFLRQPVLPRKHQRPGVQAVLRSSPEGHREDDPVSEQGCVGVCSGFSDAAVALQNELRTASGCEDQEELQQGCHSMILRLVLFLLIRGVPVFLCRLCNFLDLRLNSQ